MKGGPTEKDLQETRDFAPVLGEKGDVLMFGGSKTKGEVATLFNRLAQALAVMAFAPGGVRFAGDHFKARPEDP
jgi:hypothetical protein